MSSMEHWMVRDRLVSLTANRLLRDFVESVGEAIEVRGRINIFDMTTVPTRAQWRSVQPAIDEHQLTASEIDEVESRYRIAASHYIGKLMREDKVINVVSRNKFGVIMKHVRHAGGQHPATRDECTADECDICSILECPSSEPLHRHHDGCPSCNATSTDGEHNGDHS